MGRARRGLCRRGRPLDRRRQDDDRGEPCPGAGHADEAASYRLKAGGFLFQAGKFPEADAVLSLVALSSAPSPLPPRPACCGPWPVAGQPSFGSQVPRVPALPPHSSSRFASSRTIRPRSRLAGCSARRPRQTRARAGRRALVRHRPPFPALGSIPAWLSSASIVICSRKGHQPRPQANGRDLQARSQVPLRELQAAQSESEKTELLLQRARLDLTPIVGTPEAARTSASTFPGSRPLRSISTAQG